MKNTISLCITIISVFLFNCFAQKIKVSSLVDKKTESTHTTSHTLTKKTTTPPKTVKYYHVKEKINMNFGGYTTTYDVSDPKLVNTYDLGPNNTRVVTPRFEKEAQLPDYKIETIKDSLKSTLPPSNLDATDNPKKNDNYAYVYMIKTYERVAEKGYKSVDIFKKLGNYYYYNNELDKATKCYDELFVLTSDVEPEYYYRYAQCLQSKGLNDKALAMLEIFNKKSEVKSKDTSRK